MAKLRQALNQALAAVLLAGIGFYRRFISPMIGPRCRFTPTCSAYGLEAIQKHGPWKGGWLTVKRLLLKNPKEIEMKINNIPGVLENGLFVDLTDKVLVGKIEDNIPMVYSPSRAS